MVETTYVIEDRQFYRRVRHTSGRIRLYPICNFTAWITDEQFDGEGQRRFKLQGELKDGTPLESFWLRVYPRGRYKKGVLAHLSNAWGIRAIVAAGAGNIAHLKAAIQWYSLQKDSTNSDIKDSIKIW